MTEIGASLLPNRPARLEGSSAPMAAALAEVGEVPAVIAEDVVCSLG